MVSSRPDIAFTVGILGRHAASLTTQHMKMARQLVRYFKGTQGASLKYPRTPDGSITIEAYSDTDWAGASDRKSTTGTLILLNGTAVIWQSKKQTTVATSSTHAEYVALAASIREILWLRQFLKDLGIESREPTPIFEDNVGCILMTENNGTTRLSKHIDVQYHFNHEAVENGIVELVNVPTEDQLADGFTKALPKAKFEVHVQAMGLHLSQ